MKQIALLFLAALAFNTAYAEENTTEPAAEPEATDVAEAIAPEATEQEAALEPRLPLNELRVFAEAFNRISSAYVEEIDDKTLLENAIKGMLTQLDPHSAYLDAD